MCGRVDKETAKLILPLQDRIVAMSGIARATSTRNPAGWAIEIIIEVRHDA
jgi:hypothetical protein